MFDRVTFQITKSGDRVKSIEVKVKANTTKGPWRIADIQIQEGSVATEYVEHVSEMERSERSG